MVGNGMRVTGLRLEVKGNREQVIRQIEPKDVKTSNIITLKMLQQGIFSYVCHHVKGYNPP